MFSHLVDVEPVCPQVRHEQEPALTAQAGAVEPGAVRVGLVLQENKNRLRSSTCGIGKSFKCEKHKLHEIMFKSHNKVYNIHSKEI